MAVDPKSISIPVFKKLESGDYTVLPYQAFKRNTFTNTDYSSSYGMRAYTAVYPMASNYPGRKLAISSSRYQRLASYQDVDPKILWTSINNLFYKNGVSEIDYNASSVSQVNLVRHLYGTASVFSVPHRIFGEGIKPGSLSIDDYSNYNGSSDSIIRIRDDGFGNLYDASLTTSSYADSDALIGYWSFDDHYQDVGVTKISSKRIRDWSVKSNHARTNTSLQYAVGISGSGNRAVFNADSYVQIQDSPDYSFGKDDDFALSFWLRFPTTQSSVHVDDIGNTVSSLITKKTTQTLQSYVHVDKSTAFIETETVASSYPFNVELKMQSGSGSVVFSRKGGNTVKFTSSSYQLPNVDHHIVCQKSGSLMQIYVNGTLDASASCGVNAQPYNRHDIFIGAYTKTQGLFSGSLDEVRLYNTSLTTANIGTLYHTESGMYQTNHIGNVFYSNGIAVVSDPRYRYRNVLMGRTGQYDYSSSYGFNGSARSVVTIYEHEVVCKIKQSEFNFTMNPTIRENADDTSDVLRSFVTASEFTPYVTTIGLYNDRYELVAVAKLANPVPKRSDVDLNFIVRFDA